MQRPTGSRYQSGVIFATDTRPEGIDYVYVNGGWVLKNGSYVGGQNGVVVLKAGKA